MIANMLGVSVILFVAGFMENGINGWHTRAVAHGRTMQSLLSGFIYVMVWYTALRFIVEYLDTLWIAVFYALGSGVGSMCLVLWAKHYNRKKGQ
jgi:hypothetical protein